MLNDSRLLDFIGSLQAEVINGPLQFSINRFLNAVLKASDAQNAHLYRQVIDQSNKLASCISGLGTRPPTVKDSNIRFTEKNTLPKIIEMRIGEIRTGF